MYDSYKAMSKASGAKKPQEARKARVLWKMKAAKEAGEEYYDPTREDNILGKKQDKISTLGRAPEMGTGQSFEVRGEFVLRLTIGLRPFVEFVFNGLWPRELRHGTRDVGETLAGKCLAPFGSVGQRAFAHSIHAFGAV